MNAVPLVANVVQICAMDAAVHHRMCWATLEVTPRPLAVKTLAPRAAIVAMSSVAASRNAKLIAAQSVRNAFALNSI